MWVIISIVDSSCFALLFEQSLRLPRWTLCSFVTITNQILTHTTVSPLIPLRDSFTLDPRLWLHFLHLQCAPLPPTPRQDTPSQRCRYHPSPRRIARRGLLAFTCANHPTRTTGNQRNGSREPYPPRSGGRQSLPCEGSSGGSQRQGCTQTLWCQIGDATWTIDLRHPPPWT